MEQFYAAIEPIGINPQKTHCESLLNASRLGALVSRKTPAILWCDTSQLDYGATTVLLNKVIDAGYWPIVLSARPHPSDALACIQLGARGYCHSFASIDQFQQVASVVSQGGYWLGESSVSKLIGQWLPIPDETQFDVSSSKSCFAQLTEKEQLVAHEIAKGACNKEISDRLLMSERSVKSHLTSIFDKLAVRDRVQLALKLNGINPS